MLTYGSDYYNGCGDNHHLSSRLFKQNVILAAQSPSKSFDMDVMSKQYAANAKFSQFNNPYLYYFPFPMIGKFHSYSIHTNMTTNLA